jgi:hypothetical protein
MQHALTCFKHKTNYGPSSLAKIIKTPIRVNLSTFVLCGVCSNSAVDELEYIYRRDYLELIKEWVAHLAKTTL